MVRGASKCYVAAMSLQPLLGEVICNVMLKLTKFVIIGTQV